VRVVFDSNVLARAHHQATGPARRALLRTMAGPHTLILSAYLLAELERILTYPRLLQRSGMSQKDIVQYLENLAVVSCLVGPAEVPAGLLRDPTDAPVLGTALAGGADYLCTRDADFFEEKVQRYCAKHGIKVLNEVELLDAFPE